VDGSPEKVAYFKFNVAGLSGAVDSAKLRLHCVNGSSSGGTLYSLSDTGWGESALTFNNRPAVDGPQLGELGPVNVGDTVEVDVTSAILGTGTYSFAIASDYWNRAEYSSREDAAHPPVLIITTGVANEPVAAASTIPPDQDTDGDGIPDQVELAKNMDPNGNDSDGDGIDDFLEWGSGDTPLDTDRDGVIDALDLDSDNDGKVDTVEGFADDDNDGAPNFIDIVDTDGPLGDQDHDGVNNSTEVTYMMNPNRPDSDEDGLSDGAEFGSFGWPLDSEGDQIIDALDIDSDNDGKTDAQEGWADGDQDGAPNYVDAVDTDGPDADQDGDGLTNIAETNIGLNPNLVDSDADGILDLIETGVPNAPADTDGDGITDGMDRDSDDDGVLDAVEGYEDFDADGVLDRLDPRMATMLTDTGQRMALKVAVGDGRLAETGFVRDPIPDHMWEIVKEVRFNGLSFEVREVPTGGSVGLVVMMDHDLSPDAQYWKLDPSVGYYAIPCTVSGNWLAVTLTDGGGGDIDHLANGVIVDPAVIAVPRDAASGVSSDFEAPGGGAGEGACRLSPHPSSFPAALWTALLLLFIGAMKRKRFL
jgi:hypothetical protein